MDRESRLTPEERAFIAPEEGSPAYSKGRVEDVDLARMMAFAEDSERVNLIELEDKLSATKNRSERSELKEDIRNATRRAESDGGSLEIENGIRDIVQNHREDVFIQRLNERLEKLQKTAPWDDDNFRRLNRIKRAAEYIIPAEKDLMVEPDQIVNEIKKRKLELKKWIEYLKEDGKPRPKTRSQQRNPHEARPEVWGKSETYQEIHEREYWLKRAQEILEGEQKK